MSIRNKKHYLVGGNSILPSSEDTFQHYDLHLHTNWTDGKNTVAQMYSRALQLGLKVILFSEHVRKESAKWFFDFKKEVLKVSTSECTALVGVESKIIDFGGSLDCNDDVLQACDLVIGSVHRFPQEFISSFHSSQLSMSELIELEFNLAEAIIKNPSVDILGHPFGMCIKRFGITPPAEKMQELIYMAAQNNVAFEVNARYHSNPRELITWCKLNNAMFSLGSDAHSTDEVGRIISILNTKTTKCI